MGGQPQLVMRLPASYFVFLFTSILTAALRRADFAIALRHGVSF